MTRRVVIANSWSAPWQRRQAVWICCLPHTSAKSETIWTTWRGYRLVYIYMLFYKLNNINHNFCQLPHVLFYFSVYLTTAGDNQDTPTQKIETEMQKIVHVLSNSGRNFGPTNQRTRLLLSDFSSVLWPPWMSFLFQRISLMVHHFNTVLLLNGFV